MCDNASHGLWRADVMDFRRTSFCTSCWGGCKNSKKTGSLCALTGQLLEAPRSVGSPHWGRLGQAVPSLDVASLSVSSWALLIMSMTSGILNFLFFFYFSLESASLTNHNFYPHRCISHAVCEFLTVKKIASLILNVFQIRRSQS